MGIEVIVVSCIFGGILVALYMMISCVKEQVNIFKSSLDSIYKICNSRISSLEQRKEIQDDKVVTLGQDLKFLYCSLTTTPNLLNMRYESGLSLEQIAKKLGITELDFLKWETCENGAPDINLVDLFNIYREAHVIATASPQKKS